MRQKKGFTLTELIITLAIIIIVAAIAIPLIINYVRSAQMIRYNDYAKTIYLGVQSYLSDEKSSGNLEELKEAAEVKGQHVTEDMTAPGYYGGEGLNYLLLSRGAGEQDDTELEDILKKYIGDLSILDETVCVEYNPQTGAVYSVCYTESKDAFFYSTTKSTEGKKVSISDRDAKVREELRFGYYSAAMPDDMGSQESLETPELTLVNGNQLYAKWSDAQPEGAIFEADIDYKLTVSDTDGKPLMSFTVSSSQISGKPQSGGSLRAEHYLVPLETTYYNDDGTPRETVNEKHWFYRRLMENTYTFVLDSIDTSQNVKTDADYSLTNRYPELADKRISLSLSASSDYYRPAISEARSNEEHTLFADKNDKEVELANARHLYNLHSLEGNGWKISQNQDISWREALKEQAIVCSDQILDEDEIYSGNKVKEQGTEGYAFASLAFENAGGTKGAFDGIYSGNGHSVQGLYFGGDQAAGLFEENAGTIENLTLSGLTVRNPDGAHTGSVAAVNTAEGKLSRITVIAEEITGGDNTGGITGVNEGSLDYCSSSANINGGSYVGGIIGYNAGRAGSGGSLNHCETTGGIIEASGSDVGGIIGRNQAGSTSVLSDFTNRAQVTADKNCGGIVGRNYAGTIRDCENTGLITARQEYGGGITGSNGTGAVIDNCRSDIHTELTEEELKELATGDWIGGITGYNNGMIKADADNPVEVRAVVAGKNYVGGIAGRNDTRGVIRNYRLTGGTIIATGDFAGGFIGLNTWLDNEQGSSIGMDFYSNPAKVTGRKYVGGTIGANLVTLTSQGQKVLTFTSKGSGAEGAAGNIDAEAFAGGIVGYNGIVQASGSVEGEKQLEETLTGLREMNIFAYEPQESGEVSQVVTRLVNSNNRLSVTADRFVGGMIGLNSANSTLEVNNCVNYGSLSVNTVYNQNNPRNNYSYYIGGITGRNSGTGKISKCVNAGNVDSLSRYTGGITEVNDGIIKECVNSAAIVTNKEGAGGIAGLNGEKRKTALIEDCTATSISSVSGKGHLGSFAGDNSGKINNCVSYGSVRGSSDDADYLGGITGYNTEDGELLNVTTGGGQIRGRYYIGGITGRSDGNIGSGRGNEIVNRAKVSGQNYAGGIAGTLGKSAAMITRCDNEGTVTAAKQNGRTEVGGITGANIKNGIIKGCTNKGDIIGGGEFTGGIVSYNDGILSECEAQGGSVTGSNSAGGLVGQNEENGEIILFSDSSRTLLTNVYSESSGSGTGKNYYLAGLLADNRSEKMNTFEDIRFEGQLAYNSQEDQNSLKKQYAGGIIPVNRAGDTIRKCEFAGSIRGGNQGTGGISGANSGKVIACRIDGDIKDGALVASSGISGGLIGICRKDSVQEINGSNMNSKGTVSVKGKKYVGGYFGKYESEDKVSFTGCKNYAKVYGEDKCGGIVGEVTSAAGADLKDCVNNGSVYGKEGTNSGEGDIGGIAGFFTGGDVTLTSCSNNGEVNGRNSKNTGGIVGRVSAPQTFKASGCLNQGTVRSDQTNTGGIAGAVVPDRKGTLSSFESSRNKGDVYGVNNTGGIIGINGNPSDNSYLTRDQELTVKNCINIGSVAAKGSGTGGVIGVFTGKSNSITGCSNQGSAEGTGKNVGGIAGQMNKGGLLKDCVNEGSVSGSGGQTGGILGEGASGSGTSVTGCTNEGRVSGGSNSSIGGIAGILRDSLILEQNKNLGLIVDGKHYVGGIAGQAEGSAVIRNCTNGRAGSRTIQEIAEGGAYTGGIAGNIKQDVSVSECVNYSDFISAESGLPGLNSELKNYAGGIIGQMSGGTAEDCKNEGSICQTGNRIGGIAGSTDISGSVSADITNNDNTGNIQGTASVGGIVGRASFNSTGVWTLKACTNSGAVSSPDVTTSAGNDGIGGIIGYTGGGKGSSELSGCVNYGSVKLGSYIGYGGGIAGYANQGGDEPFIIRGCLNYGEVDMSAAGKSGGSYGGIAGTVANNTQAVRCYTQNRTVTGHTNATIGGIAGSLTQTKSIVSHCINGADVIGAAAMNIGGIVGNNQGQIISCQNTNIDSFSESWPKEMREIFKFAEEHKPAGMAGLPKPEGTGVVHGGTNMGGIAGKSTTYSNSNNLAMIYSEKNEEGSYGEFDETKNTMEISHPVKGYCLAGGIVGHLTGGSVVRAYNAGAINVADGTLAMIGGIAGRMEKSGSSTATLAGVFHIGTISGTSNNRGGIVGYRESTQRDMLSVKDAFYGEYSVEETRMGGTSERRRIGNEAGTIGAGDRPLNADGTKVFSFLNEAEFAAAYPQYAGRDYGTHEELIRLIHEFLSSYQYKLDAPQITDVTVTPEVSGAYTINWAAGQGEAEGYRLYFELYEAPGGAPIAGQSIQSGVIGLEEDRTYGKAFSEDKIGLFFKVGVQAVGKKGLSTDSEIRYTDDYYMILPPMLSPVVKADPVGPAAYRFTIENTEGYVLAGKPAQDIPRLGGLTGTSEYYQKEAYEKYENGLAGFQLYLDRNTVIPFEKQADGSYALEYTFDLGSAAQKQVSLSIQAMPKTDKPYSYYMSKSDMELIVRKTFVLDKPQNPRVVYSGDLNEASYLLSFEGVEHASGYEVRAVSADGRDTLLAATDVPKGNGEIQFGLDKSLFTEERLGKEYTVYIKAVGNGSVYLDSEEAEVTFTSVKRLKAPDVSVEHISGTDRYQASWSAMENGGNARFAAKITQTDKATGISKVLFNAGAGNPTVLTGYTADYTEKDGEEDTKILNGFDLDATVTQVGEYGVSLNSLSVSPEEPCEVMPRIPAVTSGQIEFGKPDKNKPLRYSFSWSSYLKQPGVSAANCTGYTIYCADDRGRPDEYREIGRTDGFESTAFTYNFEEELLGKNIDIFIVAHGKDGVSSSSLRGGRLPLQMPGRPNAPVNLTVTSAGSSEPQTPESFEQTEYTAAWEEPGGSLVVSSYRLEILKEDGITLAEAPDGTPLAWNVDESVREKTFHISASCAGQNLKARVRARTLTELDSDWMAIDFTVPEIEQIPEEAVRLLKPAGQVAFRTGLWLLGYGNPSVFGEVADNEW